MLEFFIAVLEDGFRFEPSRLVEAAQARWPGARVTRPGIDSGSSTEAYVDLSPHPFGPQLGLMRDGDGIGVDAPTREDAAEVIT